jgi:hypothetical protein
MRHNLEIIFGRLPDDEWPYGAPEFHESCCALFKDSDYCDCKASDGDEPEWGEWTC